MRAENTSKQGKYPQQHSKSPTKHKKQDNDIKSCPVFMMSVNTMHGCLCLLPWDGVALAFCTKNTR